MARGRGVHDDEGGQTIVLVALMFTMLCGFAALSLDVGRFYAERRFLQDAVDAAALACAREYANGSTSAQAWSKADVILTGYNLKSDPLGLTITYPVQNSEEYFGGVVLPKELKSGILPVSTPTLGCRVALYVNVPTALIKLVNPSLQTIGLGAQGYAKAKGGLVPVVVPKHSNGPGPGNGDPTNFIHHTMRENFDYQCSVTSDVLCTAADATNKGREFVLFGASQKATNDNSFRVYIALDVRDFQTVDPGTGNLIHTSYNGVAPDASINTLKDFEANWIKEGYPGPDICTVSSTSFLPCSEVAVISGASAGIFISPIQDRYKVGDRLLAQLYDGTVKTIPNFTISMPTLIVSSGTASVPNQTVVFTFSSQFRTAGATVTTSFISDNGTVTGGTGDALNPWNTGNATAGSFSQNPTTPNVASYNQTWSGITTTNAPQGISVVFLQGVAGAPYAGRTNLNIVSVNISDQKRQFAIDGSEAYKNVATAGTDATYSISVTTQGGPTNWNAGANSITLQIDQCPKNTAGTVTLTCFLGASPGVQSLTTDAGTNHTLTVQTSSGVAGQTYTGWIRAFGTDTAGKKVTKVLKITTAVNVTSGGTTDFVDVVGYAVFEITAIDSNDVKGKAVSGSILNVNDPALALGKKLSLVPWELD
ncbi:MAG: pilus assembly protein TadG-related protein [Chloroflexota bacterium]